MRNNYCLLDAALVGLAFVNVAHLPGGLIWYSLQLLLKNYVCAACCFSFISMYFGIIATCIIIIIFRWINEAAVALQQFHSAFRNRSSTFLLVVVAVARFWNGKCRSKAFVFGEKFDFVFFHHHHPLPIENQSKVKQNYDFK